MDSMVSNEQRGTKDYLLNVCMLLLNRRKFHIETKQSFCNVGCSFCVPRFLAGNREALGGRTRKTLNRASSTTTHVA